MQLWPPVWLPFVQEKKVSSDEKPKKPIDILLDNCRSHLKKVREKLIIKAFHLNMEAYGKKVRKSGELYFSHPLAVANIVAKEIPLDDTSVIAALLHDIPNESDKFTIEDIRSEFGAEIADIIDGVSKIQTIESHSPEHHENYRKLLISLFKDVRIILIKIADRLHNMRTLDYIEPNRQKRIAGETLEIYAPFAHRFGLGSAKWELEELSFKYINPAAYGEIDKFLQLNRDQRELYIKDFTNPIIVAMNSDELFKINNIKFEINGRPKHIYSIYNKSIIRDKSIDELYDLFAIRIIIESEDSNYCFLTYGIISEIYKQVPETFKNYISSPKKNGYQSLHVAFFGKDAQPVEVQIRTRNMHEVAEKGVAAHFNYKRGLLPVNSFLENKNVENWMESVRNIFEAAVTEPTGDFLEKLRINLQLDEIYVFTPTNEFRVLPKDSSPLDFAYAVHSELGNTCIGAKINGRIVPLSYKLSSGDKVEILTSKTSRPHRIWLNYAVTTKARTLILKYLKDESGKKLADGRNSWILFQSKLNRKISNKEFIRLLELLNCSNENEFYLTISRGTLDDEYLLDLIQKKIFNNQSNQNPENNVCELKEFDAPLSFANCCCPVRGDKITGIMTNGKNIEIHRNECRKLQDFLSQKNTVKFKIEWFSILETKFVSRLKVVAGDSHSMLNEITSSVLRTNDITLKAISFSTKDFELTGSLTIQVKDLSQLNAILVNLQSVDGVKTAERLME